jgi:SAM-dependent methyltransferase
MEDRARIWNDYYQTNDGGSVRFDNWIEKHFARFDKSWSIVEFGCGFGFLSEALLAAGFSVLATDLSAVALKKLKERVPAAQVMVVDLTRPLPFPDGAFDCALADLCLHYFSGHATRSMVREIGRVLAPRGCLCARVNSCDDMHHGAGQGLEIEPGFYNQAGHYKRFFDEPMIRETFKGWEIVSLEKYDIRRHDLPKNVYEVALRNAK